ncbi:M20 family metallopeptidase [Streptomyces sp. BI20]|uniref:M20 family metallopeptidase n=1 Tax=Streptomyces sp. BI20 TaxID=3403460 RepID=UPI003C76AD72
MTAPHPDPTPAEAPGTPAAEERARRAARTVLAAREDELLALSHALHADPELAYQEHRAARRIADLAERAGFAVTRASHGLETAFEATAGSGELVLAICAEYDALPGIGHACGHNVNGSAAVAAALALAPLAEDLGITVKLLGTPAEEFGGGKVDMIRAGAFDDVAAAMMVHAAPSDSVGMSSLAISSWNVTYDGVPAHAAAMPHRGVNAADALMIAQVAIAAHRQQMLPGAVVSGVVTAGGDAPNVIPARTAATYDCRALSRADLTELQDRIRACFEAGALATGAELLLETVGNDYADLRQDHAMARAYLGAARDLGRRVQDCDPTLRGGSTDMGNVSHLVPTIHPMIGYDCGDAIMHHPDFTRYGITPGADRAVLEGGLAMAWTGITLALDPEHRARLLDRRARRAADPGEGAHPAR